MDRLSQFRWFRNGELDLQEEMIRFDRSNRGEWYKPLKEHTGLYLNFIALSPTPEAFLEFAREYGLLSGIDAAFSPAMGAPERSHGVEYLNFWRDAHYRLNIAELLRRAFQERDFSPVVSLFEFHDDWVVFKLNGPLTSSQRLNRIPDGPPLNESIAVGLALQSLIDNNLDVDLRLLWNPGFTQLGLYRVPKDLRSAMWLQFARALEGNKTYLQCAWCKDEFEINSSEGGRKDKRFCSTACRARFFRFIKQQKTSEEKAK